MGKASQYGLKARGGVPTGSGVAGAGNCCQCPATAGNRCL